MVANLSLFGAPDNMAVVQSDLNVLVNAFNAGGVTTAQTNQSLGIIGISNTIGQSSSSTFDARSLSIEGAGNISIGMSNGSLVLSGANITNFSAGISTNGNTAGTTGFAASNLLLVGGNNITLSQSLNGSNATLTFQGASQLNFVNSNGISFTTNGANVTASYTVPSIPVQTNQTLGLYGAGNTTGTSSGTVDARSLSINAIGAISAGFSNGSLELSVGAGAQSNQTLGLYAVSNTTQNTSGTANATNLSFEGAGGVSVGVNNGSVIISGANAGGIAVNAGTQTQTSGTLVFANSNGISFGMSGSSQITATYTVPTQTNQTIGGYAVSNTTLSTSNTIDARSLSFAGAGIASVGVSNGSIQISVPTQTAQTQNLIQAVYDGANSITTGTIRLTNANGVSFSVNGQTLSASVAAQTNQTIGLYALGNTTQNSSTTLDARTLSFNGLGAATMGFSNGSIQVSVPTQTNQTEGFYAVGNTTQNSSTTLDARTHSFNGLGGISVGYSNGSIQISGPSGGGFSAGMSNIGNTAGTSGTVGSQIVFAGTNNIRLSQSVNGNSATLSFDQMQISRSIIPFPLNAGTLATAGISNGTMSFQAFINPANLSATRADVMLSVSINTLIAGALTTAGLLASAWMGIYTNNAGTLSSLSTGSNAQTFT